MNPNCREYSRLSGFPARLAACAAETEAYCSVQYAVDYSSVSRASLQETGVFLDSAGDFWEFSAKKFEHRSPETNGDEKSPHVAGFSHPKKEIL
jgi:hypothetical protein